MKVQVHLSQAPPHLPRLPKIQGKVIREKGKEATRGRGKEVTRGREKKVTRRRRKEVRSKNDLKPSLTRRCRNFPIIQILLMQMNLAHHSNLIQQHPRRQFRKH